MGGLRPTLSYIKKETVMKQLNPNDVLFNDLLIQALVISRSNKSQTLCGWFSMLASEQGVTDITNTIHPYIESVEYVLTQLINCITLPCTKLDMTIQSRMLSNVDDNDAHMKVKTIKFGQTSVGAVPLIIKVETDMSALYSEPLAEESHAQTNHLYSSIKSVRPTGNTTLKEYIHPMVIQFLLEEFHKIAATQINGWSVTANHGYREFKCSVVHSRGVINHWTIAVNMGVYAISFD